MKNIPISTAGYQSCDTDSYDEFHTFSKILQEEIDKEIIESLKSDSLAKDGWTIVPTTWAQPFLKEMWITETTEWCRTHTIGEHVFLLSMWHFKDQRDAIAFKLRYA